MTTSYVRVYAFLKSMLLHAYRYYYYVALLLYIIHVALLLFTGWIDHLVSYESERQRHNVTSTAGIDGLYRLYSTQFTPLVLARSLGLATVNALNPIKVCIQLTS